MSRLEKLLDAMHNNTSVNFKPRSRVEKYLSSIIQRDTDIGITPLSRVEKYLLALVKQDVEVPPPQSRFETYLHAIVNGINTVSIRPFSRATRKLRDIHESGLTTIEPITFQAIEDDKLVVYGAYTVNELSDGLYLDCVSDWTYPVQDENVLTIEQVYSATQNGNVLEVE